MTLDLQKYRHVVVLTGAGLSAASGLTPFRGPGGFGASVDWEHLVQAETLAQRPGDVLSFLHQAREAALSAAPNAGHFALAAWGQTLGSRLTLVTQNIDGLHQRSGATGVLELHGSLLATRCTDPACGHRSSLPFWGPSGLQPCPVCGRPLRPDVVLFGEALALEAEHHTKRALRDCDLFLAIGTSGTVAPAALYVNYVKLQGARTVWVNLEPTDHPGFDEQWVGRAEEMLATRVTW